MLPCGCREGFICAASPPPPSEGISAPLHRALSAHWAFAEPAAELGEADLGFHFIC